MTFDHALPLTLMAPQDPSKRVSIDDAMSHPWFSKRKPDGAEGLAVGGNNVRETMKEFNAKRAVLKLTNLRQRGRLSSVVDGAVDGVGPIAAIKNFMGGARPRAATQCPYACTPILLIWLCDPACTPAHPYRHEYLHRVYGECARARLHGAGRRGSVAEELDKAGGGAASPQKGRYTRRRSSAAASESIQEAASKLNVK